MSGKAPVGWISAAHPPLSVREAPASYVLDAQRVRPGYKQTDVGVIPEDWDVATLGVLISSLDAGVSVNSIEKDKNVFAHDESILKTSCVLGGKFLPEEHKQILPRDIHRAKLNPRKDSIIFSRMNTPALVGECGYVGRNYPNLFMPDRLWMTRHDGRKSTCVRWLAYLLSFGSFNRAIKESATGTSGSMKNISKGSLLAVQIPLPTKAEQAAIARALSDADALIESLEQLIVKKRDLKQGAMQELLTCKKRLPGFSGEWETFQIGEFADVKTGPFGSSLHESDYVQEGTPIITVEHLGEFGVTRQNLPLVSNEDCKRLHSYALEIGDIVFSRVGSVDRNALIRREEEGWLFSGRLLRVRPDKRRVFAPYLSFQFHTEAFKNAVIAVAVGQTMASLNTKILRELSVAVPTIDEQTAIATVLSDMDTEIAALETRLAKTRELKQGMMHNLLTGRIRLV